MENKNVNNNELLEKERKAKLAQENFEHAMWEEKRLEKRKLYILDEIKNLGLSEEEYWNGIVEGELKKDKKQRDDDEYEYMRKLEESGKTAEERLYAWLAYQSGKASKAAQAERKKKQNRSRFNNFGQWNYDKTEKFEKIAATNGLAAAIFLFFARKSDIYNKVICSYKVLQEQFNVSERTIGRAIQCLEENQLITIYKSGTSNVYVLDNNITWKSDGWRNEYCEFDATVILARSEQRKERSSKMKKVAKERKKAKEKEEANNEND